MKALVKSKPGPGFTLREVQKPVCGSNDILIKVDKAAICGTDLHIFNWDSWAQRAIHPPLIPGHEYVGHIVEKGEDVQWYEIGERVSAEGHIFCGVCRSCRAGRRHLCTNALGIGVQRDGGFAEYVAVPAQNAWHVHESIPDRIAAIFDPLGNAAHSALSFDLVGEDVLITGAGPIGIMAAYIARHAGARKIVVTDINDYRLEMAKDAGADRTVNVKKERVQEVMKALGLIGFDVGMEMSGNENAFETMLESMYHGGRVALLGLLPKMASVDWDQVIFKGLTIKGIYGREIFETWYKVQTMLQSGLDVSKVITHQLPFDDFQKGFEAMNSGKSGKVILDIT
ncbi:MAG: L-threonine 3-dehydrogenase [Spirochaetia bacterium]